MTIFRRVGLGFIFLIISLIQFPAYAQCTVEIISGHAFLTPTQGCAPFNVQIKNLYANSTADAVYTIDWGDGTIDVLSGALDPVNGGFIDPIYTPDFNHTYLANNVDCGYDIVIEATNPCTLPEDGRLELSVSIWDTDQDDFAINPGIIRVCQGFATTVQFADDSDWNCFPRAFRENNAPRWIQWIYGTGPAVNRIPGIAVDAIFPGGYPYFDPLPAFNPLYPVNAPAENSLLINVPVTLPADIGKEFWVTLRNWNQCNPYDADISDGNPRNPINGDLLNGDSLPIEVIGRIEIVDAPNPDFQAREFNSVGVVKDTFCIGDQVFFENLTPAIGGANFAHSWEYFDGPSTLDPLLGSNIGTNASFIFFTPGPKRIRLTTSDNNAQGACQTSFERTVYIFPTSVATINTTAFDFCQEYDPLVYNTFNVVFTDISPGTNANTGWEWNFFTINSSTLIDSTRNPTAQVSFTGNYSLPGTYMVELVTSDLITGCDTRDTVTVTLYEKPMVDFISSPACLGDSTFFTDLSTHNTVNGDSIILWEWDFENDGIVDLTFNDSIPSSFPVFLNVAGTYNVRLRVTTNKNNCFDELVKSVNLSELPIANISANPVVGCSPLPSIFRNLGDAVQPVSILSYEWQVDEGGGFITDSIQNPGDPFFADSILLIFDNPGTVNKTVDVRLKVTSVDSCISYSNLINLIIQPSRQAGFSELNYDPLANNCSPVNVDFEVNAATHLLTVDNYIWFVSDLNGMIYSENNPGNDATFNYSFETDSLVSKTYQVSFQAIKTGFCFQDSTRSIRVNPVPSADFGLDTLKFNCDTLSIEVNASQKGLINYNWEIEINGSVFSSSTLGDNFIWDFSRPASVAPALDVTIRLITENLANCLSEIDSVTIVVPPRDDINTFFTVNPAVQTQPMSTVMITNQTIPGPWIYEWEFGDGTTSNDPDPGSHTYALYGQYLITLTVTNGVCVETHSELVIINPAPPEVDFTYDPESGCKPLQVNFANISKFVDPESYFWDFGDGSTSREIHPTHTYVTEGSYTVSLRASNPLDTLIEIKPFIIDVYDLPVASFDVRPNPVFIPDEQVQFKNTSIGANDFLWDFGDGTFSTEYSPQHLYLDEGIYTITLIATNEYGCKDTLQLEGGVEALTSGNVLIPNAFTPNPEGPNGGIINLEKGRNDVFYPVTRGVTKFFIQIFNRWGELIYESRELDRGWDGYYRGKLAKQDVYVYKLELTFENGENITKLGDVILLR